jgi:hypothetical protein
LPAPRPQSATVTAWLYSAGVVLSFLAVAALLMACAAPGRPSAGAFSCNRRAFVIALAYLFVVMGLAP